MKLLLSKKTGAVPEYCHGAEIKTEKEEKLWELPEKNHQYITNRKINNRNIKQTKTKENVAEFQTHISIIILNVILNIITWSNF